MFFRLKKIKGQHLLCDFDRYGLRGDSQLLSYLRDLYWDKEVRDVDLFVNVLINHVSEKFGVNILDENVDMFLFNVCKDTSLTGLSGNAVSCKFWRETGFDIIRQRFYAKR